MYIHERGIILIIQLSMKHSSTTPLATATSITEKNKTNIIISLTVSTNTEKIKVEFIVRNQHFHFHVCSKYILMSEGHHCRETNSSSSLKNERLVHTQPFSLSSNSSELWHRCTTEVQQPPSLFMTSQKRYCLLFTPSYLS